LRNLSAADIKKTNDFNSRELVCSVQCLRVLQRSNRKKERQMSDLMNMWRKGNDAGKGFAVGEETDSPSEAAEREGYENILVISPEGNVICNDDDRSIVVCDSHGPWAVDITDL
jgi:hypothetical protein